MTELLRPDQAEAVRRIIGAEEARPGVELNIEMLWERANTLKVQYEDRSVVVKLAKHLADGDVDRGSLQSEATALALCNATPDAIAPRLLGFDRPNDVVVMEELPPGRALADHLLHGDAASVNDAMIGVAVALAGLHASTTGREEEYVALNAELDAPKLRRPWLRRAQEERGTFCDVLGQLVPIDGLSEDVERALSRLESTPHRGLVHGDICPDNVRVTSDAVRIFDFEASCYGPIALDTAYLLAPYPSCWCFATLPSDVADGALHAYLGEVARRGVQVTDDFSLDLAAALACYLIAWLGQIPEVLSSDEQWGTTTVRPRFLAWLESFERYPASEGSFPSLTRCARALRDHLHSRWPEAKALGYPALAAAGEAVTIPSFWRSDL